MGLWRARSLWRFTPLGATLLIDAPRMGLWKTFDYGLYCDETGRLVGERSAVLLVHRSAHLERVYADEGGSLTYVDQLVVDEASLGSSSRPVVHSFSNKQRTFAARAEDDALKQLQADIQEARSK